MIRDTQRLDTLLADIRAFVRERWHPLEDRIDREGAIPEDVVDELRRKGYFGWSIPEAKKMLDGGFTLEEIEAWVRQSDLNPQPKSGRQEYLENVVNRYV